MQRFFGITPSEYFTVGRRRLQGLSVTCPHFFLRAIWLLAFLVCSSHYLCSSPLKWSFVSCFKSSYVISKSPICARLTHIWSREFWKSCHRWFDGGVQTCQLRTWSQELSCKCFKSRETSFHIVTGNHVWINIRFVFEIWALSIILIENSFIYLFFRNFSQCLNTPKYHQKPMRRTIGLLFIYCPTRLK